MSRKNVWAVLSAVVFLVSLAAFPLAAADQAAVLGTWDLEIDAGGEYYYLTMIISLADGALQGTVSEANGYFYELPLKDIKLEDSILTMKFISPTPPDGLEREVLCRYDVGEDVLEGTVSIEELGLTAMVSGKREKK